MEDLLPSDPRRVGPYEVVGRLRTGGAGGVFLGRSPDGKLAAVTVAPPGPAGEGLRESFRQRAATPIPGTALAAVADADPDGDPAWLATRYIDAPSLADAVRSRGPMTHQEVLTLGAGLAEALWLIHRAGLSHRDLKPANVLLANGGPRVVGLGPAAGTPAYMAPEQISGRSATPASDVFALGGVLAFAVTGRAPFEGGTPAELVYRVVRGEPDLAGIGGALRELVSACLTKNPALRPAPADILAMLNGSYGSVSLAPVAGRAAQPSVTPVAPPISAPTVSPEAVVPTMSGVVRRRHRSGVLTSALLAVGMLVAAGAVAAAVWSFSTDRAADRRGSTSVPSTNQSGAAH